MSARPRRRLLIALLVVLPSGCSVGAERSARVTGDEAVPFGLLDAELPPLPSTTGAEDSERVLLCFVQDGQLAVVEARLRPPIGLGDVVDALGDPPDTAGRSMRTAIGDPPLVREVRLVAGVAQVDLLPAITALGGDEQLLAVAQLVCSLTGRPGVGPVSFTLEGSPVDVPRGDGSLTSGAVSRDDYADLLL